MKPWVSVVIPAYNHERFIEQAIRSVLTQTYPKIELIVVDDCSTDGTAEASRRALSAFGKRAGRRVSFHRHGRNRGAHAAITSGLKRASGKYLTLLNSDDYYYPERLEVLVEHAESTGQVFLLTLLDLVSETGSKVEPDHRIAAWYDRAISQRHLYPSLGYAFFSNNLAVTTGNLFFSHELYEKTGPFGPQRWVHDLDFMLRATLHEEPVLVPRSLMAYRIHSQNEISGFRSGEFYLESRGVLEAQLERVMVAERSGAPIGNPIAPCPRHWPRQFRDFLKDGQPFFSDGKLAQHFSLANQALWDADGDTEALLAIAGPSLQRAQEALYAYSWMQGIHIRSLHRKPADLPAPRARVIETQRLRGGCGGTLARVEVEMGAQALRHLPPGTTLALFSEGRAISTARPLKSGSAARTWTGLAYLDRTVSLERLRTWSFEWIERQADGSIAALGSGESRAECLSRGTELVSPENIEWRGTRFATESTPEPSRGWVDFVRIEDEAVLITGWALDFERGELPVALLPVCGGRELPVSPETRARPDLKIAPQFDPKLVDRAGFQFRIPLREIQGAAAAGEAATALQLFALFPRGTATHLLQYRVAHPEPTAAGPIA